MYYGALSRVNNFLRYTIGMSKSIPYTVKFDLPIAGEIAKLAREAKASEGQIIEGIVAIYLTNRQLDPALVQLGEQVVQLVQAYKARKRTAAGQVVPVQAFKTLRDEGLTYTAIGARYGLHRSSVQRALARCA